MAACLRLCVHLPVLRRSASVASFVISVRESRSVVFSRRGREGDDGTGFSIRAYIVFERHFTAVQLHLAYIARLPILQLLVLLFRLINGVVAVTFSCFHLQLWLFLFRCRVLGCNHACFLLTSSVYNGSRWSHVPILRELHGVAISLLGAYTLHYDEPTSLRC